MDHIRVYATLDIEIDPYSIENKDLFRDEKELAEDRGWERWRRPSPEPMVDRYFKDAVVRSLSYAKPTLYGLIEQLANRVERLFRKPHILILAILRAGFPISILLGNILKKRGYRVSIGALSLFQEVGWDRKALRSALEEHPNTPVLFVDGWTSRGSVANMLSQSYKRWIEDGNTPFFYKFAVLLDPFGFADLSASLTDQLIPTAFFTAPESLGFSRGFIVDPKEMFHVYRYPQTYFEKRYWEILLTPESGKSIMPYLILGCTPSHFNFCLNLDKITQVN